MNPTPVEPNPYSLFQIFSENSRVQNFPNNKISRNFKFLTLGAIVSGRTLVKGGSKTLLLRNHTDDTLFWIIQDRVEENNSVPLCLHQTYIIDIEVKFWILSLFGFHAIYYSEHWVAPLVLEL